MYLLWHGPALPSIVLTFSVCFMVGLHSEKDNLFSVCMIFEKQQIIYQVGKQPMLNSRPLSKMNYSLLQGVRKC